jgi:hypothetical protein
MRSNGKGKAKRKPYAWSKEKSRTRNDSITADDFRISSDSVFVNDL